MRNKCVQPTPEAAQSAPRQPDLMYRQAFLAAAILGDENAAIQIQQTFRGGE